MTQPDLDLPPAVYMRITRIVISVRTPSQCSQPTIMVTILERMYLKSPTRLLERPHCVEAALPSSPEPKKDVVRYRGRMGV